MDESTTRRIADSPRFVELTRKREAFSWLLSLIMLVIYYGFIVLIAFWPQLLAQPISASGVTTLGFPLGIGVILSAIVLTGIYVYRANGEFDRLTREIVESVK